MTEGAIWRTKLTSWPKKNPGIDHIFKYDASGEHLSGKHLTVRCSGCHQVSRIAALGQPSQLGLECYICHKVEDPHKGTFGFKLMTLTFNASAAYDKAAIKFTFSKLSGTLWVDAVSLVR